MSAFQRFSFSPLLLLPLAWLWFTLINHLRVEWSVNPQYAYGWAVPLLCLYLFWRKAESRKQKAETSGGKAETLKAETLEGESRPLLRPRAISTFCFPNFSFLFLSFLYLPTRLIQEANPEWRLVSWALALEVIGLTLLLLRMTEAGSRRTESGERRSETGGRNMEDEPRTPDDGRQTPNHVSRITFHVSRFPFQLSAFCFSNFLFPILFFLIAVPWPTFLEGPLVQGLMRANVSATIELLALTGVPAIQHGNVIEIASGVVGIDDACSGIRSLQAALMLSLFFGEVYRLAIRRRLALILLGFLLAFVFNVGRTLLLTQVAAAKGVGAVAAWHDPAGVTILVACFLCLWLMALALRKAESRKQKAEMGTAGPRDHKTTGLQDHETTELGWREAKGFEGKAEILKAEMLKSSVQRTEDRGQRTEVSGSLRKMGKAESREQKSEPVFARFQYVSFSAFQLFSIFLIAWLLFVEAGTELWYRSHEWGVPKTATWEVELPRDNPTFRELPFSDKTKQFLRYDEARNGVWEQGDGHKWQAIFLRWNPGRIAVHLAKSHTPEVCLTAAGRDLVSQSGLRPVRAHGLELPFRSYVVKDETGPLHVFYCLWEDRASAQSFRTTKMSYANRLAPVLAGRRNSGQRSLEVAIWGIADQNEADAALAGELAKLIKVEQ